MTVIAVKYLWIIIQVIIGFNLVYPILLYVFHKIHKKFNKPVSHSNPERDYAVIVTAYQQTASLPAVVNSLLKLNYSNYLIYIVADNCDISSLNFTSEKVILLRPEETLASNTRSHFYAINRFKREHDYLTIIDSDNLVDTEYLNELNGLFNAGYLAVQGVREAKNLDTTYACLDAARDIYYHFYDGKLLFEAGSSATLAGSGMAFSTKLYRECLEHLDIQGAGFDKVLQTAILNKNHRIAFSQHAIVYDEKTSRSDQLVQQRSRWINTWFKYFKYGFTLLKKGVQNLSINQLLFGLVVLRPPLFIFLILSVFFGLMNLLIDPYISLLWLGGLLFFVLSFAVALSRSKTDKRIYRSLINIPKFILFQVISLLNARKANIRSVATTHFHDSEIDKISSKETLLR